MLSFRWPYLIISSIPCLLLSACIFSKPQVNYSSHTSGELNDFGVVYDDAGNIKKAAIFYKEAIKKDPQNYVAVTNLGNIYFREGQYKEAAQHYETALKVNPMYVPALNNLGNVQIELQDYDKAEEKLSMALRLADSKEERKAICSSLGTLLKEKGHSDEAEKWFRKADKIKLETVIDAVPFFRQITNGCGPAALASVYNYLGKKQSPTMISERVYDNKIKGTLNLRILIDAREQGLEAIIYSGSFKDIKTSIDEANPLILMISSGLFGHHYLVVVGYEGEDMSSIIVHDGYKAFAKYTRNKIQESWKSTGYCTILIRQKGETGTAE